LVALAVWVGGSGQGRASYVHFGDVLLVADPATHALLSPRPSGGSRATTATGFMNPQLAVLASDGDVYVSEGGGQAVVIDSRGDTHTFHVSKDGFGAGAPKRALVMAFPASDPGENKDGTGTGLNASLGPAPAGSAASPAGLNGSAGAPGGGAGSSGGGAAGGERGGQAVTAPGHPGAGSQSGAGLPPSDVGPTVTRVGILSADPAPGTRTPASVGGPGAGFGAAGGPPLGVGGDLAGRLLDSGDQQGPSQIATLTSGSGGPRSGIPDGTEPDGGPPFSGLPSGTSPGQQPGGGVGAVPPGGNDPVLLSGGSGTGSQPRLPVDGWDSDSGRGSAPGGADTTGPAAGGGGGGALDDPPASPEPASLTLLAIGALGLLGYGWRMGKPAA
jgi:hypothetical protein